MKKQKIIGFENHGGQTFDTGENFGTVLYGNGNKFGDLSEGFRTKILCHIFTWTASI